MTGRRYPELADPGLLERWHHDEGATVTEVARRVGCTISAVSNALRRHDLEVRRHRPALPAELSDAAWMRDQYVDQGRSAPTIARILGVDPERVRRALVAHGLRQPRRTEPEPEPELDVPAHWRFLEVE